MSDEELKTLVANLVLSSASNDVRSQNILASVESLHADVESLHADVESLRQNTELQSRSIESLREGMTYNTEAMATALELAAISQKTAAEMMELSAHTFRGLDQIRQDTRELQQMMGIVIKDNQADRNRIQRLEDEEPEEQ